MLLDVMVQCVCLYACVLEVQISKTGDFSTFFFFFIQRNMTLSQ